MGAANFFQNFWPLSQNHRQTHEVNIVMLSTQKRWWMFPRNTAGHHKRAQSIFGFEGEKMRYSTPIEKKRVSESKIPKPTSDKST
jgi:hypothetical protein